MEWIDKDSERQSELTNRLKFKHTLKRKTRPTIDFL